MKQNNFFARIFKAIKVIFFPEICACCRRKLLDGEALVCSYCQADLPLSYDWLKPDNYVRERLVNSVDIVDASSFFVYRRSTMHAKIIHALKFSNTPNLGLLLGGWYGKRLREYGQIYADADVIVPLPLHKKRLQQRGYNQAEMVARGIASELCLPIDTTSVIRSKYTAAQSSLHGRNARFENVKDVFSVVHPDALEGKHLILVDDVLTTGASLAAFAEVIAMRVPTARISVAVLSATENKKLR